MAVKIRLQRLGKRSDPLYRIILTDESKKRDGRSLDILGTYNPSTNPPAVVINRQKLDKYLSLGAKMSKTVASAVKVKTEIKEQASTDKKTTKSKKVSNKTKSKKE